MPVDAGAGQPRAISESRTMRARSASSCRVSRHLFCHELEDGGSDFRHRQHMVDARTLDRALRHRREQGISWILRDGDASGAFDRKRARGSVIEHSAEHNPDDAFTKRDRRAAKHRINGGTIPIFARTTRERDVVAMDQQMMVWRRDIDAPIEDRVTVRRVNGRQRSASRQNSGEHARALRRKMDRDENRRRETGGQRLHELS